MPMLCARALFGFALLFTSIRGRTVELDGIPPVLHGAAQEHEAACPSSGTATASCEAVAEKTEVTGLEELLVWLRENGAKIDGAEPRLVAKSNRGMIATRAYDPDDEIGRIPMRLVLSKENLAKESELAARILERYPADLHKAQVAFFIEKKDDPFWGVYVKSVPATFSTVFQFSDDEKALLENSWTLKRSDDLLEVCRGLYDALATAEPSFVETTTFEEWTHYYTAVTSRDFSIHAEDGSGEFDAIVPWADLFNHVPVGQHATSWKLDGDYFVWFATSRIEAGEPIVTSYGAKGSQTLLVQYGFTDPLPNRHDETQISVPLEEEDPLYNQKMAFLGGQDSFVCALTKNFDHELMAPCLAALRVMLANADESDFRETAPAPISARNERAVLATMAAAAAEDLARYPTTVAEDEALLAADDAAAAAAADGTNTSGGGGDSDGGGGGRGTRLNFNQRNAIAARLGEKNVLEAVIVYTSELIALLNRVEEARQALPPLPEGASAAWWLQGVLPLHAWAADEEEKEDGAG